MRNVLQDKTLWWKDSRVARMNPAPWCVILFNPLPLSVGGTCDLTLSQNNTGKVKKFCQ